MKKEGWRDRVLDAVVKRVMPGSYAIGEASSVTIPADNVRRIAEEFILGSSEQDPVITRLLNRGNLNEEEHESPMAVGTGEAYRLMNMVEVLVKYPGDEEKKEKAKRFLAKIADSVGVKEKTLAGLYNLIEGFDEKVRGLGGDSPIKR